MIVATAGHVDHGKTRLIKMLTGIETDRLPEEQQRGLSIDLGFAYQRISGGTTLGFVDVPGHERFVSNMLAGTACIDFGLLVVSADDGPMPQTREHLAILDLLKIPGIAVVVSKTDRVPESRRCLVVVETRRLVQGTTFEGAPIFLVSSETGEGADALRAHLHDAAASHVTGRKNSGNFRLAVDRCFTLQGVGVVVTGAALSGVVAVNDALVVSPSGQEVRVRSLRAQDAAVETARAGERIAMNLVSAKLHRENIRRGDWLVAPAAHHPTVRLDVRVSVLPGETSGVASFTPVHVHIGAADVPGRIVLLEGREIAPGASGLAQIILARPITAAYGDRFVFRDQSARRTIGGGLVLDPLPSTRKRNRARRIAMLKALESESETARLRAGLAAADGGLDLRWFCRAMNLTDAEAQLLLAEVNCVCTAKPLGFAIERRRWASLTKSIVSALRALHERSPEKAGASELELSELIEVRVAPEVLRYALSALVGADTLRQQAGRYFLSGHRSVFDSAEAALWSRIRPMLEEDQIRPPVVSDIAERLAVSTRTVVSVLDRAVELGLAHRIAPTRFFLPEGVEMLARVAERVAAERPDGCFEPAAYRDESGIGRRVSVEMLEYFDRIGLTRRIKGGRKLVRSPSQLFQGRDSSPGGAPGLQNR